MLLLKRESHSVSCDSSWPHGLYGPWHSPGQNTGVGSCSLLQGLFPTQGLNPGLPHCRWILYQLSPQGSPRILEWAAYPFSRGSPWPRNRTSIFCIASRFFINWAIREALINDTNKQARNRIHSILDIFWVNYFTVILPSVLAWLLYQWLLGYNSQGTSPPSAAYLGVFKDSSSPILMSLSTVWGPL